MRADRRDPVIAGLRRFKPTKFEVTLADGTKKPVPLQTKANRWELLSDLLEKLPWVHIEAQDTEGNILGAIERDADVDVEPDTDIVRAEGLARVIVNAVAMAMSETRKMFADTMRAQTEMMRSMAESSHFVSQSYQTAMRVQASTIATPEGDADDKLMQMIQMALALRGGAQPTINLGVTKPAATPPRPAATNGVKPT